MTSKVQPAEIIEPLTEKTWGQGCVIFGERKIKERNGETPLRACLHGGGGPQVGEVTRLTGVTRLSI